jgi:hypothetical protein
VDLIGCIICATTDRFIAVSNAIADSTTHVFHTIADLTFDFRCITPHNAFDLAALSCQFAKSDGFLADLFAG